MDSNYYGEGIFTTIIYKDSAEIFLHFGGDTRLPIIGNIIEANYYVKNDSVTRRKGISEDRKTFWREDDYDKYLIHIGYSNVPPRHLKAFEKAIDSFKRNVN